MADLPVRRESSRGLTTGGQWDPFERMRELLRFDPLTELRTLMPRALMPRVSELAFIPDFEVKETKDAFIFKADLPGIREEDLDISITGDRLTVSGTREEEKREDTDRYYAYERCYGSFNRSFTLPEGVNPDDVRAELKNGVLNLVLGKKPEVQPRRIALGAGEAKGKA